MFHVKHYTEPPRESVSRETQKEKEGKQWEES